MNFCKKLSILLSVCLLLSSMPFTVYAEELEIVQAQEVLVEAATESEVPAGADIEAVISDESEEAAEKAIFDIVLEATAEDGMKVTLKADADAFGYTDGLSLEAAVVAEEVAVEASEELEEKTKNNNVAKRVTYDIKVMHDDEEIEPVGGKKVKVEFSMPEIPSGADAVSVYHHNDETEKIETIVDEAPINEDKKATVSEDESVTEKGAKMSKNTDEADVIDEEDIPDDADIIDDVTLEGETGGFSLYTVDFTYEDKMISILGDSKGTKLADIISEINITDRIVDVQAYQDTECTVPATDNIVRNAEGEKLFSIYELENEWYVDSMNSFTTEHGIVVETANGEYRIKVTDPGIHGHDGMAFGANINSEQMLSSVFNMGDSGFLENDITLTSDLPCTNNVAICLNGHTLDLNGHHIIVSGKLTIVSCGNGGKIKNEHGVKGGALSIVNNGCATMSSINVTGCSAEKGGAIFLEKNSHLSINNCTISDNSATVNGGGIFYSNTETGKCHVSITASPSGSGSVDHSNLEVEYGTGISGNGNKLTVGTVEVTAVPSDEKQFDGWSGIPSEGIVTGDIKIEARFIGQDCFVEGTMITMADGSAKRIEDVQDGDMVKTFDHEVGSLSSQKVCYKFDGEGTDFAVILRFENGNELGIAGAHGLLERDSRKYINVSRNNAEDYIGHYFYNADDACWDKLVGVELPEEQYRYYALYSVNHLNCIANHMISITDDATFRLNTFDLDENLKIDQAKKQKDIDEFGLYSYEDFCKNYPYYQKYITEEDYNNFNNQYVNVSVGKGMVTIEELLEAANQYMVVESMPISQNIQLKQLNNVPLLKATVPMLKTATLYTADVVPDTGLTFEGTVSIENNTVNGEKNNVYLCNNRTIAIGGAGVLNGSAVGVTTEIKPVKDNPVRITGNNSVDYSSYFHSDSDDYEIYNSDANAVALKAKENQDEPDIKPVQSISKSSSYVQGWNPSGNNWQYVKSDGTFAKNEWLRIDGKWYHFGSDTMMDTGWLLDTDGSWYYLSKENGQNVGVMQTGWITDPYDGYRYYLDPATGKMLTGWHEIDGEMYYFNEIVPEASGWTQDEKGDWVYDKRNIIPLGALIRKKAI